MSDPKAPLNGPGGEARLTRDELQALLGPDGPPTPVLPQPASPANAAHPSRAGVRLLIVARRDDELDLLIRLLADKKAAISIARNPFTALDYIRDRDFHALISDFSLWAGNGSLLFERLRQLERRVNVAWICDRDAKTLQAARSAGAHTILERPLRAAEVARVVDELLQASGPAPLRPERSRPAPMPPAAPHPAVPPAQPSPETLEGPALHGGPAALDAPAFDASPVEPPIVPAPDPAPALPAQGRRPAGAAAEVPWLRFFFAARRAVRWESSVEARWRLVLDLLLETLGGGLAAAWFPEEGRLVWRIPADDLPTGGRSGRLFAWLTENPAPREVHSGADDVLIIPFFSKGEPWRAIIAIPPGPRAARPSDEIAEELALFFREL